MNRMKVSHLNKLARFFRGRKPEMTEVKLAEVLFGSVLGRRASDDDLLAAAKGLSSADGLRLQLNAMIKSPEFAIMQLPHLMAAASRNYRGEKIFLLHVPKTAGTSLRLGLIDAMGIPALDRYERTGNWDGYSEDFLKMWPLLVGHTNVYNFPKESHRGVTVFREPRARTLSIFRQRTREAIVPSMFHSLEKAQKTSAKAERLLSNFSNWLETTQHPLDLLTWHVEMQPGHELPRGDERGINRREQAIELEKYGESYIRNALDLGLQRIQVAEWLHNKAGMATILDRALSRPIASKMPKVNEVLEQQVENPIQLSADDHARLSKIAQQSQIVFDIAVDQGLIAALSTDEADQEFEIASKRLGFKL